MDTSRILKASCKTWTAQARSVALSDTEELLAESTGTSVSSRGSWSALQSPQTRRVLVVGTTLLSVAALASGVVLAFKGRVQVPAVPATSEVAEHTMRLNAKGCCSWNSVDCGHGGDYCQTSSGACETCKGSWGSFQDSCVYGHPPAQPLPDIGRYTGKAAIDVKVMSYNLEWWATGGGGAAEVILNSSKDRAYDFMGFQECNDPWHVLWEGGLQRDYKAMHVNRGMAVDICITYRNATWKLLAQGSQKVTEDKWPSKFGSRYAMWARLQHLKTGEVVFFMNHHGPLPLNSGGVGGGPALASALLGLITVQAKPGDAVIMVGDFNADGGSLTVRQLECKLSHVAWGDKYNGVDNVFANVQFSKVAKGHGTTLDGGNSDHNALQVTIDL